MYAVIQQANAVCKNDKRTMGTSNYSSPTAYFRSSFFPQFGVRNIKSSCSNFTRTPNIRINIVILKTKRKNSNNVRINERPANRCFTHAVHFELYETNLRRYYKIIVSMKHN